MKKTLPCVLATLAALGLILALRGTLRPVSFSFYLFHSTTKHPMTHHATGTFEVNLVPQGEGDKTEGSTLARMSIDKQFHGGIEAASKGEMLSAMTGVQGSAGYVAIERVTGTLDGKGGSFVLQHTGTMTRGTPDLSVTVVPDSGTGQLTGLTGRLTIKIAEGQHSYDFEYTLPDTP